MKAAELKQALDYAKTNREHKFPLSNGWFVSAEKIYPQPARVGPAWHFVFYIISPTGKQFGGRTSIASMVSYFANPNFFAWRDEYKTAPERCPIHDDLRPCLDCERERQREVRP